MQVHFTFRNVPPSEGLKSYAREKISKMQKYVRTPLEADVVMWQERRMNVVEMSIRADGERFTGKHESEDMYASIDLVLDKVNRQVRDAKDTATARKRHSGGVAQMSGKFGDVPAPAADEPAEE